MKPPRLDGVLETVLYCSAGQLGDMRTFYSETLGLRAVFTQHPIAYRLGGGVLLIFDSDASSTQDDPPAHGATGSAHACFVTPPGDYEGWKTHLTEAGIEIRREIEWPGGRSSIYFEDPAGNLLEIADGDFWPR